MFKRTLLAAILCGLVAGTAAPAAEPGLTYYSVTATGEGSYDLDVDLSTAPRTETDSVESTFTWRSFIPAVAFRDGRFAGVVQAAPEPPQLSGHLVRHIRVLDPQTPDRDIVTDCSGTAPRNAGGAVDLRDGDAPGSLVLEPFEAIEFADQQCSDGSKGAFGLFGSGFDPHADPDAPGALDPFEQRFEMPVEAVGAGRIVQWVQPQADQVMPSACPGYSQADGERCHVDLRWSGAITFTKIDPDALAPLTGAPPVPSRPGPRELPKPPVLPAPEDDLLAPLVPVRASVDAKARTLSFTASCPTGCSGTAVLRPAAGKARAAATTTKPLATLRFKVAAGPKRVVKLQLPARAARHLRRTGRAALVVTMKPKQGAARRTRLTVRVTRREVRTGPGKQSSRHQGAGSLARSF